MQKVRLFELQPSPNKRRNLQNNRLREEVARLRSGDSGATEGGYCVAAGGATSAEVEASHVFVVRKNRFANDSRGMQIEIPSRKTV